MAESLEPVPDQLAYKPLAPLALAGFLTACLYVVVLVIAIVVAFFQGKPLIFAAWTLAVPFVSAGLCYLALRQIRASDGTRAGVGLARNGLTLSLLFGIGYLAYWLATYFAISAQAGEFANKWFEKIKAGEIDAAYLDLLAPGDRQGIDPANRAHMEARFNRSEGAVRGALTAFRRQDLVRLVSFDPANTQFRLQSVDLWEPFQGGYRLWPHYVVSAPEGEFDLRLSLLGSESAHKEFKNRQWMIRGAEIQFGIRRLTPLGEKTFRARKSGRAFFESWFQKYMRGDWLEAFLETRPPAERDALRREAGMRTVLGYFAHSEPLTGGWGCGMPGADSPPGAEMLLPGYQALCEGALTDSSDLWCPTKQTREQALPAIQSFFRPVPGRPSTIIQGDPAAVARVRVDGDKVQLLQDCSFILNAQHAADGVTIVQTDAASLGTESPQWQVVGVKMQAITSAPPMMSQMLSQNPPGPTTPSR